ncbi:unnamed protein product [Oncorhynchus mykiss]|uniref:Thioredoxin domain-containing protein n=1 Tax=Oncorhynchus mykiss TaxID=8022 RepID=A0A060Y2J5_ONCMY|nr:unnamed protein product [Oncorhynchus mykiss]
MTVLYPDLPLSPGVLAAVDTTIHKAVGERFKISGFPTVKYFEKGEEKFTLPHLRSKDKIIEFLQNPQAPPPPEQSWEDKPSSVSHLGMEDFREALKKKKHALVMFYAPCKCNQWELTLGLPFANPMSQPLDQKDILKVHG